MAVVLSFQKKLIINDINNITYSLLPTCTGNQMAEIAGGAVVVTTPATPLRAPQI